MKIFYDIDTQNDFMDKDGALYVPDAELIKPNLKLLTDFARTNFIPVLGSIDVHFGTPSYKEREGELAKYGGPFPDHCMKGTLGQLKINETNIRFRDAWPINIENKLDGKIDETNLRASIGYINQIKKRKMQQGENILIEKQSYDVFTNPQTKILLEKANVTQATVYGVATDYCIKAAVLEMQDRKIQCYVVEDAIKGVDPKTTKQALEEMIQAGAKLVTTKDVLEGRLR